MRLRKNILYASAFALVGASAVGALFLLPNNDLDEATAISGSWANFVSTAWANPADARYKNYEAEAGSTENYPYLINTAEEFSGLRAFEGGQALAGKYIRLTQDIDLSAHYWDPIELYGSGEPLTGNAEDYDGVFEMPNESEIAHLDGNSRKISGMSIVDQYDQVTIRGNSDWEVEGEIPNVEAGATGLFSYAYKARISDIRLDNPKITLSRTSGHGYQRQLLMVLDETYYPGEVMVSDLIGSVVGVSQNSRIAGVHVNNVDIKYTAEFGDYVSERCEEDPSRVESAVAGESYDCDTYFSPWHIIAGGAVGYSYEQSLIRDTSVKGGTVDVRPIVDETIAESEHMYALDFGSTMMGGLVGQNYMSAILSTCSSANISFSDNGFNVVNRNSSGGEVEGVFENLDATEPDVDLDRPLQMYGMFFGGLTGMSSSLLPLQTCIYNSCSHSTLNISATKSVMTVIGGVSGGIVEDTLINTYFDGTISTNAKNIVGEVIGMAALMPDETSHTIQSNFYIDRGRNAIGFALDEGGYASGFSTISTTEKLAADLNAGRQYVKTDILNHSNLSSNFVDQYITEWSVQDGTFPLACIDGRTAGLVFPDNRIDVPNTGVGK